MPGLRRDLYSPLLLLVLLLGACAPATPTPSAPEPSHLSSAVAPTVTAPQPPLLARLPAAQADLFRAGYAALAAADTAEAEQAFQRLTQLPLAGEAAAEARLRLGEAQVQAGHAEAALGTLEQVQSRYASTAQADLAPYFVALAARAAGRVDEARQRLADYAARHPQVAAAIWLRMAEDELAEGRHAEAAEAARQGLASGGARGLRAALLERLGEAEAALGHAEAAFDAYRQTFALAQGKGYLGEQLFHLAQAYTGIGKQDEAVRSLQAAIKNFPSARTTADALRLLGDLQGLDGLDRFDVGLARFYATDFYGAAKDFDASLAADPQGLDADRARLYRAQAQMVLGPDPEAIEQLKTLSRQADDPEIGAQALLEAGKAQEQLLQYTQAEASYEEALQRYGAADVAPQIAFRLGFAHYLQGDYQGASQAWERVLRTEPEPEATAQALFWLGKAMAAQGRGDEAEARWRQAASLERSTPYGLRAEATLAQAGGRTPNGSASASAQPSGDLKRWFAERKLDLDRAASEAAADADYQQAQALAALGLDREANWQAEALVTRHAERGDRLYWLAQRFHDLGLFAGGLQLGEAALKASGVHHPAQAPEALRAVAYPLGYGQSLSAAAGRQELDPLLLTAIVRQESGFDPWAEGPGRARGLAQLRPVRVEEAAEALRQAADGTLEPARLFEPRANLDLAAWFLADRVRRYGGRVEPTLTAYATSETAADAWLANKGTDDADVFLEQVPIDATRAYMLDVLGSYQVYSGLYGQGPQAPQAARTPYGLAQALDDVRRVRRILVPPQVLAPVRSIAVADDLRQSLGRGLEFAAAGRCAEAEPLFSAALSSDLAVYAQLQLAECASSRGEPREALDHLTSIQEQPGPRLLRLEARERTAEVYLALQEPEQARAVYRELLQGADYAPYRAQLRHSLATIERALGQREAAITQLRTALREDPEGVAGQAALGQLEAMNARDADPLAAGIIRFNEKRYREAIAYFDAVLATQRGDAAAATARYQRAVSVIRLGQDRVGVEQLRQLAQDQPGAAEAPEALFKAGRVLESLKEYRQAAEVYQQLAAAYPGTTYAPDARFRAAFAAYSQGDLRSAATAWRALLGGGASGEVGAQAQFWLGKALQGLGDGAGARATWESLAGSQPDSYYGRRAADLLAGRVRPGADLAGREAASLAFSEADRAAVVQWAATRAATNSQLEAEPGFQRARDLLGLGLRTQAHWELEVLASNWSGNGGRLALLAAQLNTWRAYNLSVKDALRASWAAPGAPRALQKLIYPVPYPELVANQAARQGADPLLFSALMRQESLFDQFARSPSHARGLTQIIAPTAYDIAQRLGRPGFQTDDLFQPEVSVEFGAWYFGRRLDRYAGLPLAAIAAYNGGDWAVDSWLLTYGDTDPDAFVEGIPYSETQPYVQHIYEFWQTYRGLYGK